MRHYLSITTYTLDRNKFAVVHNNTIEHCMQLPLPSAREQVCRGLLRDKKKTTCDHKQDENDVKGGI